MEGRRRVVQRRRLGLETQIWWQWGGEAPGELGGDRELEKGRRSGAAGRSQELGGEARRLARGKGAAPWRWGALEGNGQEHSSHSVEKNGKGRVVWGQREK